MKTLLVDPVLPAWLPELTLRRLRVGEATVSLRFHRDGDSRPRYEVLERDGKVRIVRQPWIESLTAGPWERVRDLVESAAVSLSGRI